MDKDIENEEIEISDRLVLNKNKLLVKAALQCHVYEGKFNGMKCAVKMIPKNSMHVRSKCTSKSELSMDYNLTTKRELEALMVQEQSNENVLRFYDVVKQGKDATYFVMERFDCNIRDFILQEKNGILDPPSNLSYKDILRQATNGVHYLHTLGIIHRNLNPYNIVLSRYYNRGKSVDRDVVKISDFALSKIIAGDKNDASNSGCKDEESWIAPEVLRQDHRLSYPVDVFSLGCVSYFVLFKRHPYGSKLKRILNLYEGKADLDPEAEQYHLICKMISSRPDDRPTISDIIKDPFLQPGEFYTLYDGSNCPGLCIIINQQEYRCPTGKAEYRTGTDKDRDSLSNMFSSFGYRVEIYNNLTAQEIYDIMMCYSMGDFSKILSLVVCILSHGDQGIIYGVDYKSVLIQDLKDRFNGNACPTLNGKPKIFIFQACQGEKVQQSLSDIPPTTDVLDIRATVPGFASFRTFGGSVLVSHLYKNLTDSSSLNDLSSVLTQVNETVANWSGKYGDIQVKQMPEEILSLRKKICFESGRVAGSVSTIKPANKTV